MLCTYKITRDQSISFLGGELCTCMFLIYMKTLLKILKFQFFLSKRTSQLFTILEFQIPSNDVPELHEIGWSPRAVLNL